jgi:hypothetical protein
MHIGREIHRQRTQILVSFRFGANDVPHCMIPPSPYLPSHRATITMLSIIITLTFAI